MKERVNQTLREMLAEDENFSGWATGSVPDERGMAYLVLSQRGDAKVFNFTAEQWDELDSCMRDSLAKSYGGPQ